MDYKVKLEEAKRLYQTANADQKYVLESLFPELKESEDEMVRKWLIELVEEIRKANPTNADHNGMCSEAVAWLEKQGEPADINPSEFDLRLNKLLKQFEALSKEELANCLSFYLNVVQNDGTYKADEKQGEPANKVESKFHEGDWVVQENIGVYKVIEVCESWYEVVDNKDKHYSIGFDKEYMCHLYTIKDAKDGDVLAAEDKDKIFLYNGKLDLRGRVCAYCGIYKTYYGLRFTECAVGNYFTYKEPYPATKEQRDTLERAITNAGYRWDKENLKLEKI